MSRPLGSNSFAASFAPSSAAAGSGTGSSNEETFTGTIDPALGYKDVTITDGTSKQVCDVSIIGESSGGTLALSADILNDTTLRVYSSIQTQDPGTAFSVSIKPQ